MATLFDILLDITRYAGITISGKTTAAGSALYLIDTTRYEVDDYFNHGTIFFRSGDNKGVTRRVTDYTELTGKVEFVVADYSVDSDVNYTLTIVNRETLVQAVNAALLAMGQYDTVDETLTVIDNTTIYDLPSGVNNIKRVEVYANSTDPQEYYKLYKWIEKDGKLIFPEEIEITAGQTIRLYYPKYHSEVNEDTDTIRSEYNRQRVAWEATAMFMLNRMQYAGNADERETFLLTNAIGKAELMGRRFPVKRMVRDPRLGYE